MGELYRIGALVISMRYREEEVYAAWELAVQGKHFEKIVAKI